MRVVRFSDVNRERLESLIAQIEQSDGPPPDIPATGLTLTYDADQGTAVVMQHFATAEDMQAGARAFEAMDPADTPGTRVSVDKGEVRLDLKAS